MADLADVRAALEIDTGVTDDAVLAYVRELSVFASQVDDATETDDDEGDESEDGNTPPISPTPQPAPAPQTAPAATPPTPSNDTQVSAQVAAALAPMQRALNTVSAELAALKAEKRESAKERLLASALEDGKIAPAAKDEWSANYDAAPDVTTRILASMAPGTAMPVAPKGHSSTSDALGTDDEQLGREFDSLAGFGGE